MKTAFCCIVTALFGLAAGLLVSLALSPPMAAPSAHFAGETALASAPPASLPDRADEGSAALSLQTKLVNAAYQALSACQRQDVTALSALTHPEKGVTFTPYSTVDEANLTFTPDQLRQGVQSGAVYIWGVADDSGLPIELTVSAYLDRYVYDRDFAQAALLGVDRVISAGNSLENVEEAYPDGHFVEFYSPGGGDGSARMDWRGLKLVFEEYGGEFRLVGVIHSEWTI